MNQKKNKAVIVISRQVSTANAFSPLIRKFIEDGYTVEVLSFDKAHQKYRSEKLDSILINSFKDAELLLEKIESPCLLLTGTSEFADEDAKFWKWAKKKNIPSIAFVDSWVHYWQRFTSKADEKEKFCLMPDMIAVVDELMKERMIESGCESSKLVITGNPSFDSLYDFAEMQNAEIRKEILSIFGRDYFLFAGEPYNQNVFGTDEKSSMGYTEYESVELALDALNEAGKKNKLTFTLVYKPHPRGMDERFSKLASTQFTNVKFAISDFPSLNLAVNSKAVFGMTSMLLYESAQMDVPVISVRPNKKNKSDIIDGHQNITTVHNMEDIQQEIELLPENNKTPKGPDRKSATDKFITFAYETINRN